MKKILITLSFIIFSQISYSQEEINSIENFVIENNGVVYKKVFDIPNQSEIEIKKNIKRGIKKGL